VPAGETNQETVVGYSEFVAGLPAALKKAPLELSDESSKPSRGGVYELEFILDITLMCRGEYVNLELPWVNRLRTCSASGTNFGMPLGNVGGDPGVYEAREDDSSRLETDREEGEARNGSQGLATRGLSESSSPNIDCGCED